MPTPKRKAIGSPLTAAKLLDMTFLDIRYHLLETAAALDRLARAPGSRHLARDPRCAKIAKALAALRSPSSDRAEKLLHIFSV